MIDTQVPMCVRETKRKGCGTTRQDTHAAYWSVVSAKSRDFQGVDVVLSAIKEEY